MPVFQTSNYCTCLADPNLGINTYYNKYNLILGISNDFDFYNSES